MHMHTQTEAPTMRQGKQAAPGAEKLKNTETGTTAPAACPTFPSASHFLSITRGESAKKKETERRGRLP